MKQTNGNDYYHWLGINTIWVDIVNVITYTTTEKVFFKKVYTYYLVVTTVNWFMA